MIIWNSKHIMLTAAAGTAVLAGVAISPVARDSVRSSGTDLMTMLSARSPGARSDGAVTTKGPRVAARSSRVLSPVRQPAALVPAAAAPVAAGLPPVAIAGPAAVAPMAPAVAGAPVLAAVPVVAGGGGGLGLGAAALLPVPIAAAIIGGGGGGGDIVANVPSPTPPIPEPATWLMMIVGFGMLGAFLRHRREIAAGTPVGMARVPA